MYDGQHKSSYNMTLETGNQKPNQKCNYITAMLSNMDKNRL
jgi:hypothetical protein